MMVESAFSAASAAGESEVASILKAVAGGWLSTAEAVAAVQASVDAKVSHLAGAATGLAIIIGGSQDIVVPWPTPFSSSVYQVEPVLMGLLGKATLSVLDQTPDAVTVRVTAGLLVAAGTSFLLYGRT